LSNDQVFWNNLGEPISQRPAILNCAAARDVEVGDGANQYGTRKMSHASTTSIPALIPLQTSCPSCCPTDSGKAAVGKS